MAVFLRVISKGLGHSLIDLDEFEIMLVTLEDVGARLQTFPQVVEVLEILVVVLNVGEAL